MNYSTFLEIINKHPHKELAFEFTDGFIRKDYHITEILKTHTEAIDCGGAVDTWKETILQLLEPKNEESERFMSVQKAIDILSKSDSKIKLEKDSKLVLEYRPNGAGAAQRFIVSGVEIISDRIVVQSLGSSTQCKAAVRKTGNSDSCGSEKKKAEGKLMKDEKKSGCCN